jgi:hypothetical protein
MAKCIEQNMLFESPLVKRKRRPLKFLNLAAACENMGRTRNAADRSEEQRFAL